MGHYYYLVDKEKEVQMKTGRAHEQLFVNECNSLKNRLFDILYPEEESIKDEVIQRDGEFAEIKPEELTLEMILLLTRCRNKILELPQVMNSYLMPMVYYLRIIEPKNRDWDYYGELHDTKPDKYSYPVLNE